MELNTPLSKLAGTGPGLLYKLGRLNLNTVEDLIYHFPFRYDDFSQISTAKETQIGQVVTLQGEIWSIKNIYTRSRKILTQAIFNDGTSPINLTWFNQSWLTKQIATGDRLQISGKLTKYKSRLSIIVPKWEKLDINLRSHSSSGNTDQKGLHTGGLIPVYPETEGLSSKWVRTKIDQLLPQVENQLTDPMPGFIRGEMLSLKDAIRKIHYPESWDDIEKSRERLGFDELFYISLATQKARMEWKKKPPIAPLDINKNDLNYFLKSLPFKLTSAQKKVIAEIIEDLKKGQPMNRLIQGEVGSGKTVVVAIIAYLIHLNKLRTLFMAPTEILAFQHFSTLSNLLEPFEIKVGIYTGSKKEAKDSEVIVGTHALLSEKLIAADVGLVVVDEQQRFGVEQRTILRAKAKPPHFLTTTATPIPRTVALTLYGDLDLSVINEMPKNRPVVKTYLVPEKKRADSYKFIEKRVKEGDQAYIITPFIEASETLTTVKAVKVEYERLGKIFPNLKLGLLHGRLKSKEKEQVLTEFKEGKVQILVSTSVVEVGMDIPNATIIVIEGAERFGLAQLHQLRGRVGRGTKESYCLLYTSDVSSDRRRLKYMENTFDGLKLAELDLKIRGGGEIFGVRQSGRFEFKIASFSDIQMVEKTKKAAADLLNLDPSLDKYPLLKARLQNITREVNPD
ncbi:ATP-dependent DNA helicase RecG [Candidatus Daviesbacteria bacterium]|nr:ATP-dependent DNA helicase RecG [Candidatus Daviesbacteria bacterium]